MVPIESLWIAIAHLVFILVAVVARKPSLVFKKGEWHAILEITEHGPRVDRPRTARRGPRWASRAQMKSTYAVPLGTTDRVHAEAIMKLVLGQVEGPLPTPKLQIARDLWIGVLRP